MPCIYVAVRLAKPNLIIVNKVHFKVACLIAKPFNMSEAKGDLVMIQTLLLFKFMLLSTLLSCQLDTGLYHNKVTFSLTPNQRPGN